MRHFHRRVRGRSGFGVVGLGFRGHLFVLFRDSGWDLNQKVQGAGTDATAAPAAPRAAVRRSRRAPSFFLLFAFRAEKEEENGRGEKIPRPSSVSESVLKILSDFLLPRASPRPISRQIII